MLLTPTSDLWLLLCFSVLFGSSFASLGLLLLLCFFGQRAPRNSRRVVVLVGRLRASCPRLKPLAFGGFSRWVVVLVGRLRASCPRLEPPPSGLWLAFASPSLLLCFSLASLCFSWLLLLFVSASLLLLFCFSFASLLLWVSLLFFVGFFCFCFSFASGCFSCACLLLLRCFSSPLLLFLLLLFSRCFMPGDYQARLHRRGRWALRCMACGVSGVRSQAAPVSPLARLS